MIIITYYTCNNGVGALQTIIIAVYGHVLWYLSESVGIVFMCLLLRDNSRV